ncbi:MAG: glycosyltransferase family 2 protein [Acidobacteriaceae bacterium]
MEFEQRLLRLIDDPYLLGSIRERINNFVPWFDCENVIPVSFEEIIGHETGGSDATKETLLWSLQLKLHIPGTPDKLGAAIFDESSPTFHEGRSGSWRQKMTPESINKFFSLNQDFMQLTGYAGSMINCNDGDKVSGQINTISSRAEEFRKRPLRTSKEDFRDTPFNVEWDFLGYNIVRFNGRYYALHCSAGPTDLIDLRSRNMLRQFLSSYDLESLKAEITNKQNITKRYRLMKPPSISFLLPTRGRPALVRRLFRSIAETTSHLDQVEVILYVDEDDAGSHDLDSTDFHVVRIIGPAMTMGGYNSACLEKAQGDVLILANDDMVIRTPGWDDRIRATQAEFQDQIYLSYANDLFKKSKFCTFPIMSRRTCELLVDPYPAAYRRAFIDVHLFDIFKRLQHAGFDRIHYYDDLVFEHLHYRAGKASYDETYGYARSGRFADDQTFMALIAMRSTAANRLINAIRNEPVTAVDDATSHSEAPADIASAARLFSRRFLLDTELPYRWRFFLWRWLIGRYLAANGFLKPFVR